MRKVSVFLVVVFVVERVEAPYYGMYGLYADCTHTHTPTVYRQWFAFDLNL